MTASPPRLDHQVITRMVSRGARVLDLGCGTGELMELLQREKGAKVQGVELDQRSIYECVAKGLSVVHSDVDGGLAGFPDHSFDHVIINQSIQEVRHVDLLLQEALRVGKQIIVGFPNFAVWNARWKLFLTGRTPVTKALPYRWHDTPNLRFLTILDFKQYCAEKHLEILDSHYLSEKGLIRFWPNLRAATAIILLTSEGSSEGQK